MFFILHNAEGKNHSCHKYLRTTLELSKWFFFALFCLFLLSFLSSLLGLLLSVCNQCRFDHDLIVFEAANSSFLFDFVNFQRRKDDSSVAIEVSG